MFILDKYARLVAYSLGAVLVFKWNYWLSAVLLIYSPVLLLSLTILGLETRPPALAYLAELLNFCFCFISFRHRCALYWLIRDVTLLVIPQLCPVEVRDPPFGAQGDLDFTCYLVSCIFTTWGAFLTTLDHRRECWLSWSLGFIFFLAFMVNVGRKACCLVGGVKKSVYDVRRYNCGENNTHSGQIHFCFAFCRVLTTFRCCCLQWLAAYLGNFAKICVQLISGATFVWYWVKVSLPDVIPHEFWWK